MAHFRSQILTKNTLQERKVKDISLLHRQCDSKRQLHIYNTYSFANNVCIIVTQNTTRHGVIWRPVAEPPIFPAACTRSARDAPSDSSLDLE